MDPPHSTTETLSNALPSSSSQKPVSVSSNSFISIYPSPPSPPQDLNDYPAKTRIHYNVNVLPIKVPTRKTKSEKKSSPKIPKQQEECKKEETREKMKRVQRLYDLREPIQPVEVIQSAGEAVRIEISGDDQKKQCNHQHPRNTATESSSNIQDTEIITKFGGKGPQCTIFHRVVSKAKRICAKCENMVKWTRRVILCVTITSCLLIIIGQIVAFFFGSPIQRATTSTESQADSNLSIPLYITFISLCLCRIGISIVVMLLEADFQFVSQYFQCASFYFGKSIYQVFLSCITLGTNVTFHHSPLEHHSSFFSLYIDISAYLMFIVALLHFILSLFCMDFWWWWRLTKNPSNPSKSTSLSASSS